MKESVYTMKVPCRIALRCDLQTAEGSESSGGLKLDMDVWVLALESRPASSAESGEHFQLLQDIVYSGGVNLILVHRKSSSSIRRSIIVVVSCIPE